MPPKVIPILYLSGVQKLGTTIKVQKRSAVTSFYTSGAAGGLLALSKRKAPPQEVTPRRGLGSAARMVRPQG